MNLTPLYKVVYQPQVNYFLRNVNKLLFPKFKLPVSGILDITLKNGEKIKLETNQTDYVGYLIFWNGVYSYEYLGIFEEIIQNCKGFVDIGANAGLFSLVAATVNPTINVLAFDPSNASHHFLNRNVQLNGLNSRVKTFKSALSDQVGELEFFEVKSEKYGYLQYNLGGSSSLFVKPRQFSKYKVHSYTLDALLQEPGQSDLQVDFVKIDAEGAEPSIIKGMDATIRKHKPIIVCEILFGLIENELEEAMKQYGYGFYLHLNDGLVPVSTLARENDNGAKNCFFVHPEKLSLIEKYILR
ncbi:FkbM family methyltransferase [Rufibacter quisquiliarum]|uniref:FkbM family methyltransferase n=1 Tax=Rufibacter quisquiliarum TaxID=1549639 RepID=A0A839GRG5_9BACT|nr:FkbM family methyltransferase [Rufibacter quisquiliarum]MBA9079449.1 FkbM family methyltransferase [Rufibacter quisquiliarum]